MAFKDFLAYFKSFYGPKGLHPNYLPGYTKKEVERAILALSLEGHIFAGGDSFDREKVRDKMWELRGVNPATDLAPEVTPTPCRVTPKMLAALRSDPNLPATIIRVR